MAFGVDDAALALIASGVISTAGQLYANSANRAYQSHVNDVNWQIAAQNNATQIELANTAHQREVADLKAAGLNPILSAGGSGAATPNLHAIAGQSASVDNPMEGAANSARGLARYFGQMYETQLDAARADVDIAKQHLDLNEQLNREEKMNSMIREDALKDLGFGQVWIDGPNKPPRLYVDKSSKYYQEVKDGLLADAKMQANRNWRANLQSGLDALNGAGSLYRGLKGNNNVRNYYNFR